MGQFVDNIIAFRVLTLLVTPFEKTDAFRLGIIDKDGKQLIKKRDFTSNEEYNAYTSLHKLVFNLKKLLAKVPGGSSQIATLAAAYWLVKEAHSNKQTTLDEAYCINILNSKVSLVEEELLVERFLEEDGAAISGVDAGTIPNTTGHSVSTDEPLITVPGTSVYRRLKKKLKEVK